MSREVPPSSPHTPSLPEQHTKVMRPGAVANVLARLAALGMAAVCLVAGLGFDATERVERRTPGRCAAPSSETSFIVIVLDGVRWQEIFGGTDEALLPPGSSLRSAADLTPNLHALIEQGVALGAPGHGAPFLASGPNFVSLPGYHELLVGRPPRCLENDCEGRPAYTLLDAFAARGEPDRVAAISSWRNIERVAAAKGSAAVVTAGRTGGDTRDELLADADMAGWLGRAVAAPRGPVGEDYRYDEYTSDLALAFIEAEPAPPFVFVSLGDTDEHAHDGNYVGYLEALHDADAFVGEVARIARERRADGIDTTIIVTADHGRAADFKNHGRNWPESARSWLIAAGGSIPSRGYVDAAEPRYLRDVAPTIAAISSLPIDLAPSSGAPIPEISPDCALQPPEAPPPSRE